MREKVGGGETLAISTSRLVFGILDQVFYIYFVLGMAYLSGWEGHGGSDKVQPGSGGGSSAGRSGTRS